ncbi:coiled-coil domain-containing protein 40-like isoform X2 [Babylonia areolata]|uniref:coiled-coil domain-containing protein 40-like isoform X2 n=1 Tax=Babylonia areolata TaxID=304850 RepID=UPI003FD32EE0
MERDGDEDEEQEQECTGAEGKSGMVQEGEDQDPTATAPHSPGQPDGDGGDGDSGDDDDDEEEEEEEDVGDTEGSDDEDQQMVIMDPDHPLMKRFQAAFKSHLEKQDTKLMLELKELVATLKSKKVEREDLGVELYGTQQDLARHQMNLECLHDHFTDMSQQRFRKEEQLREVRALYRDTLLTFNKEKQRAADLLVELENLALRLFYMGNAKDDIRGDIGVMRRAAEKVESQVTRAEKEKQKQDLYVDRLVERVDKLSEEMAMYEAQIIAQGQETRAAQDALMEANVEMLAIGLEKKQLYQQWTSSLIGMRRRDEAHAAMQLAEHQQEQMVLTLEMEIEGYKKSILKAQEENEKLTLILNRTERDIENTRKLLVQCNGDLDALKARFTTYTRVLQETEQALLRAIADKTLKENELDALRKQIQAQCQEKMSLEDQIMERLQSQMTLNNSANYTLKLTEKAREQSRRLESQIVDMENNIAKDTLEAVTIRARLEELGKLHDGLDSKIKEKNNIISRSEMEIHRMNATDERQQNLIDFYSKKLDAMISASGGVELGPLEIQINSVLKSIDKLQHESLELQQRWLRRQTELVRLCHDKDAQSSGLDNLKSKLTILSQKKIRLENEIEGQNREIGDVHRTVRTMETDIWKLNVLLFKERDKDHQVEQDNILKENVFIADLKAAEKASIELTEKLEKVTEEKESLLNKLFEAATCRSWCSNSSGPSTTNRRRRTDTPRSVDRTLRPAWNGTSSSSARRPFPPSWSASTRSSPTLSPRCVAPHCLSTRWLLWVVGKKTLLN